ncbi:hypothetical protein NBRGN_027_02380 [Nocardia brasiliensis NBRC 14402]|nr:hypothetical protein NBRGN_027_02380 [Nocardia brasiliensis NBRC 14402]
MQGVGEEGLGGSGLGDDAFEVGDLLGEEVAPFGAGGVEDGAGGVQGQAEALRDLDEGETAHLVGVVHPFAAGAGGRAHQAALVVVAQGRRGHAEYRRGLTDRDQIHPTI